MVMSKSLNDNEVMCLESYALLEYRSLQRCVSGELHGLYMVGQEWSLQIWVVQAGSENERSNSSHACVSLASPLINLLLSLPRHGGIHLAVL
jgi:hypothetical protein